MYIKITKREIEIIVEALDVFMDHLAEDLRNNPDADEEEINKIQEAEDLSIKLCKKYK